MVGSDEFSRTDREQLLGHGFLRQVMKGWLLSSGPDTLPGDTAPWYASFWEFCSRYCPDRFGEERHLSQLTQKPKHHLADPALAARLLGDRRRIVALEVKLSRTVDDADVGHLLWLREESGRFPSPLSVPLSVNSVRSRPR